MGYFSNSTSFDVFERNNCLRCVHHNDVEGEPACPVIEMHLLFNYGQLAEKDLKAGLELLIPTENGDNKKCRMFVEAPNQTPWDE